MSTMNATPGPVGSARTSTMGGIAGAMIGAMVGAVLWGVVGKVTGGFEFKYGAVVIGALTGGGAALLGRGHSATLGVLGSVFGLVGIVAGKGLFEVLVHPDWEMSQHVAYHLTPIDFVFYAATVAVGFAIAGTERAAGSLDRIREAVPMLRRA